MSTTSFDHIPEARRQELLSAAGWGSFFLTNFLADTDYTADEKNYVVQTYARAEDPNVSGALFPLPDSSGPVPRDIATALQFAYDAGAIDGSDLLRIADSVSERGIAPAELAAELHKWDAGIDGSSNDMVRAMATALEERSALALSTSPEDSAALADSRMVDMLYASNDELMRERFEGNPERQRDAFRSLVDSNENYFDAAPDAYDPENLRILAATRVFAEYGALSEGQDIAKPTDRENTLMGYFSGAGGAAEGETLSRFFSHTVIDPRGSEATLDGEQTVGEAVAKTSDAYHSAIFSKLMPSEGDSNDEAANGLTHEIRMELARELGNLKAAISGSITLALDAHSDSVERTQQFQDHVVGSISSLIPTPDLPFAGEAIEAMVSRGVKALSAETPPPPSRAADEAMHDHYSDILVESQRMTGDTGLITGYESAKASEADEIYKNLNINPGGYEQEAALGTTQQPNSVASASGGTNDKALFESMYAATLSGDATGIEQSISAAATSEVAVAMKERAVAFADAAELESLRLIEMATQREALEQSGPSRVA